MNILIKHKELFKIGLILAYEHIFELALQYYEL